ncbi:MAG: IS3 family transposase, partial [Deltaproteobacteria bacterium]|nr:IS3 family transposase [Deltaproteobacteria bacterium]
MVQRMIGPAALSATALAATSGVPQPTLSRWLRDVTCTLADMSKKPRPSAPATPRPRRPEDWPAEERLRVVMEAAQLGDEALGAFLRERGLHEATLAQWRAAMLEALAPGRQRPPPVSSKRERELEKQLRRKDRALAEAAALLVLPKKSPSALGGRGRRHEAEERRMIIALVDEAVRAGARIARACDVVGVSERCLQRWRAEPEGVDRRAGPSGPPAHQLSEQERQAVLDAANRQEFRNLSPRQIVPLLADRGQYIASESTFYRVLREAGQLAHRQHARPASHSRPREHVARGPNQVWSWDITYLRSDVRGTFFYLYLIVDVWSRKIVGWNVHLEESAEYAGELITTASQAENVDPGRLVLHADNGGPMKGSTMLATLQRLGVVPSFSRPRVSDDNPFAEALFRTLKYCPSFPHKPFRSVADARAWVGAFVAWYNDTHLHSGIRYVTPSDRHARRDRAILRQRTAVYATARSNNPRRWTGRTRDWTPVGPVFLNPVKQEIRIPAIATPV